jgi:hypothetical protein
MYLYVLTGFYRTGAAIITEEFGQIRLANSHESACIIEAEMGKEYDRVENTQVLVE